MPATPTETAIRNRRKSVERGDVLIPLFEELLRRPIEIEDEEDVKFLEELIRKQTRPRQKGVYSPSSLGACMRQAYFSKTGQRAEPIERPVVNTFFAYGNFLHLKLQFWLFKLHRAKKLQLIDCEIRVHSASGDFVGTIDAIVVIGGVYYIIDFKGYNTGLFMKLVRNGLSESQKQQLVGYGIIVNSTDMFPVSIEECILVAEHKAGPIQGRAPFGFVEYRVRVSEAKEDVKSRIGKLREHEKTNTIPEPACQSTKESQFSECVFQWYCRAEVRGIERERADVARREGKRPTVARASRGTDGRADGGRKR